jgi:hypothetical protein
MRTNLQGAPTEPLSSQYTGRSWMERNLPSLETTLRAIGVLLALGWVTVVTLSVVSLATRNWIIPEQGAAVIVGGSIFAALVCSLNASGLR